MESTEEMIKNQDENLTNQEVFMADFFKRVDRAPAEIMPIFEDFYRRDFPKLQKYIPSPGRGREMVEKSLELGLNIVIATNPVFPIEAIEERLRWGRIDNYPYQLITSYEKMHFCKPSIHYYEEILEKIGAAPGECIMVGNDSLEDMVAGKLGITTFLLTDFLIDKDNRIEPDFQGNTDVFLNWLEEMGKKNKTSLCS